MTQAEHLELRAADTVAQCLNRRLMVPLVYFEAKWPGNTSRRDLVLVDRAGAGDIHVVEIKRHAKDAIDYIPKLLTVPASFKWLAVIEEMSDSFIDTKFRPILFSTQGRGRIGLIRVSQTKSGDLQAFVAVGGERFTDFDRKSIGDFVSKATPDIDFGQSVDVDRLLEQESLSRTEVTKTFEEVRKLRAQGHLAAAFLIGWSAAESIMRKISEEEFDLRDQPTPPSSLIRLLHGVAMLSDADRAKLESLLKHRNELAHGYRSAKIDEASVDALSSIVDRLRENVGDLRAKTRGRNATRSKTK